MAFSVGEKAGDYEFIDVLDSSKSGVTYRVKNVLAQRFEALKVLPSTLQDDQETVDRFLREMHVRARILHPNIVTFYNASSVNGQLVMTTELVEGTTLAGRLELGPLDQAETLSYISQVLSALACAHENGVIHRDITPTNIFITPEGTAKLAGFALAKSTADPKLTQVGVVLGSLHYMSPEQVKGVGATDVRSDLYSVGVVLYECLTGKKPFDSQSQFEIMAAHVTQAPKPPIDIDPRISPELNAVVLKALAKEPADRFQTAEEFHLRLTGAPEDHEPAAEPQAPALEPEIVYMPETPIETALVATVPSHEPLAEPARVPAQRRSPDFVLIAALILFCAAVISFAMTLQRP